jgi:Holliday junction resolvase RusA-like endonuclease
MVSFFVAGIPVPKGSAKAFMNKGMRFPVVVQDNAEKQRPWASSIGYAAQQEGAGMISGPVEIKIVFYMPYLKSHYGTGKNANTLKANAPTYHTSKPDLDKLIRCVKDALTGIAWRDDSQVAVVSAGKCYGLNPGAQISVSPIAINQEIETHETAAKRNA